MCNHILNKEFDINSKNVALLFNDVMNAKMVGWSTGGARGTLDFMQII